MEPVRVERRVLHGQEVDVKIYPPQQYVPSPVTRGCGWAAYSSSIPSVDVDFYADVESWESRREREGYESVDPNDYHPEDLVGDYVWDSLLLKMIYLGLLDRVPS